MKVVSINIGESRELEYHGNLVKTGIFKYPVDGPILLQNEEVQNDNVIDRRYHGGTDKACYAYSVDHYSYWNNLYPDLKMPWGMFGENLSIEGLHEESICIGDTFTLGTALVQATQPRQPCFKLEFRFEDNRIVKKFVESGYCGVYFRVLNEGLVNCGDRLKPAGKTNGISISRVFQLLYTDQFDKQGVLQAVHSTDIAESCRKDLLKRWGEFI